MGRVELLAGHSEDVGEQEDVVPVGGRRFDVDDAGVVMDMDPVEAGQADAGAGREHVDVARLMNADGDVVMGVEGLNRGALDLGRAGATGRGARAGLVALDDESDDGQLAGRDQDPDKDERAHREGDGPVCRWAVRGRRVKGQRERQYRERRRRIVAIRGPASLVSEVPRIQFRVETERPPATVLAALTDFGPHRAEVWPNVDSDHFKVHDQGPGWAEVTEGSAVAGGVWERERYSWDGGAGIVSVETLDSNIWGPGSRWEYRLSPAPSGTGTLVDVDVTRNGKGLKGGLIGLALSLVGTGMLRSQMQFALNNVQE